MSKLARTAVIILSMAFTVCCPAFADFGDSSYSSSSDSEAGWSEMSQMDTSMDVQPGDALAPGIGEMDVQPGDAIDSSWDGAH